MSACYYDVEEELYPANTDTTQNCYSDTASYSTHVAPVLATNCYGCHAQNLALGNIVVDSYATVKALVDNGKLKGSVNHESGFSVMPPSGQKLGSCDLEKINDWIAGGALNN
ncbi:MAG: hypothetical protein IPL35_14045 [Sphingobacteriales bacterium]|nr:hypothetical protein [Sphingobacteriales bacterium]